MPAPIKLSEIRWAEPIKVRFGFSGLESRHATRIMREMIRDTWPEIRRPEQCVYVIRLIGEVAPRYPIKTCPTIYIGEGKAAGRISTHTEWLTPLVLSVPQMGIEIRVAEIARKNHTSLYQYIEADLIAWFCDEYGCLPWFNLQRERSKEGHYDYEVDAINELKWGFRTGRGVAFQWTIEPTHNNEYYRHFATGHSNT